MEKIRSKEIIDAILIIFFILLLLPFPKVIQEILMGLLFLICFFFCFWGFTNFGKNFNERYTHNLPYLIFLTMLLQIHSTRFSLVANKDNDQLLCVQLYKWITEIFHFSDAFNLGILLYFWFLMYYFILLFGNGIRCKINIYEDKIELYDDCSYCIEKLRKYMISCFVICFFHFVCEIIKDILFLSSSFKMALFSSIVITIGTCGPFVIIYLMMARFVYRNIPKAKENDSLCLNH